MSNTKEQYNEMLDIIQAYIDGNEIEFASKNEPDKWRITAKPKFAFDMYKYRIKPKYKMATDNELKDYNDTRTAEQIVIEHIIKTAISKGEDIYYRSTNCVFDFKYVISTHNINSSKYNYIIEPNIMKYFSMTYNEMINVIQAHIDNRKVEYSKQPLCNEWHSVPTEMESDAFQFNIYKYRVAPIKQANKEYTFKGRTEKELRGAWVYIENLPGDLSAAPIVGYSKKLSTIVLYTNAKQLAYISEKDFDDSKMQFLD